MGGRGSSSGRSGGGKILGGEYGKIKESDVQKLEAMGAKRWQEHGNDRLYINNAAKPLLNFEERYEYHKGRRRLEGYYMNGEELSNSGGAKILNVAQKAYINLKTGEINVYDDTYGKPIVDALSKYIKKPK